MGFALRSAAVALALTSASFVSLPSWAGDDGAAPLWQGIGSIFAPAIDYRPWWRGQAPADRLSRTGKLVLPPKTDLPPPGTSAAADPSWPVNQEILRKKALKEEGKENNRRGGRCPPALHARVSGERTVTIRAVDPDGQTVKCQGGCGTGSSVLSNLNPLKWVGMGASRIRRSVLSPDREWLTDPPKGFRAPVEPIQGSAKN